MRDADLERFNQEIREAFEDAKAQVPASRFTPMRPVELPRGFRRVNPQPTAQSPMSPGNPPDRATPLAASRQSAE